MTGLLTPVEPESALDAETAGHWLEQFRGPALLHLPGEDRSRCRALVTLLHGNESSGLEAIHGWLREDPAPPVTDLVLILANVEAARSPPRFHHRQVPGERDLNRCFRPPWQDRPGRLAREILETLIRLEPEAVLDVHNTSGASPPFTVSTLDDGLHRALAGLLAEHLVITDLRLGALMDVAGELFPVITLECGGAGHPESRRVARHALELLAGREGLLQSRPASGTPVLHYNPVRVELTAGTGLSYGTGPRGPLTLREDIESLNLQRVEPGEVLGWQDEQHPEMLIARDHRGRPVLHELLRLDRGVLSPARPLRIFMATGREDIAAGDCLFYAAPC